MNEKVVIKYTRNGIVEENLSTNDKTQLTTSEWGSQLRYEKQRDFHYDTTKNQFETENLSFNKIKLSNNESDEEISVKSKDKSHFKNTDNYSLSNKNIKDEIYYKKTRQNHDYTNNYKQDTLNQKQNYTKRAIRNNNGIKDSNSSINNGTYNTKIHKNLKNNVDNNINYQKRKFGKSIFLNKRHRNVSSNNTSQNNSGINGKENKSELLKGVDTNHSASMQTGYNSELANKFISKVNIKTEVVKKTVSMLSNNNEQDIGDENSHKGIKIFAFVLMLTFIVGAFPIMLIFSFSAGQSTFTQIEDSYKIISQYVTELDDNLKKEIDEKVEEDKKLPNTEVIVENKEVIGTMTREICAIAIGKLNFTHKLTDGQKQTIKNIHNKTYEYRVTIINEAQITKKTYRVLALSLDELINQSDLSDEEKALVKQVIEVLNEIIKPPNGGDIPPSNPNGFANPMLIGTYTVTQLYGDSHKGIDLGAAEGTPIYASANGVVRFAGFGNAGNGFNRYGYCVFIDHQNGFYTMYAHASALYVSVGETVNQGQLIAGVGNTGQSFGNHLHFEIRGGFQYPRFNPSDYIKF